MHSKKKILMIAPTPFFSDRGCHIRIYEQAHRLVERGNKIVILTYPFGKNIPGIKTIRVPNFTFYKDMTPGFNMHKPFLDLLLVILTFLLKLIFNPDIVYCFLHEGFLIGLLSSGFSSKKLIFDCQGSLSREIEESGKVRSQFILKAIKIIEDYIYKKARVIFVSSASIKDDLCARFGSFLGKKIIVVEDGPSMDIITNDAKTHSIEGYELDKKKIIIYTGVLSKSEGIDILLKSIKELSKIRKDFMLLVIGYPHIEKYQKIASSLGIEKYLKFLGRINYFSLSGYLNMADIAVAPKISKTEAHGKILNYLAAGLPVVCFKSKINEEILGKYGIYVENYSSAAFAKVLNDTIANLHILKNLREERKEYVTKRFSWTRIIDIIENICDAVMRGEL